MFKQKTDYLNNLTGIAKQIIFRSVGINNNVSYSEYR